MAFWQRLVKRLPPSIAKVIINLWPPFLGAGIKIEEVSKDSRYVKVSMNLRWYNKNYVNTHFGGSIFAMVDPFYMLMLIQNLGRNYIVWVKSAHIDFKKPGLGKLTAVFKLSEEEIKHIREQVDTHGKYIFDRKVDVTNTQGEVVASVIKTLYVKQKSI